MAGSADEATTILVTPVWNDSTRLSRFAPELARVLATESAPVAWVIADDGSAAAERPCLEALREEMAKIFPRVSVHFATEHRGKGAVIREVWDRSERAGWLAFVDADGSVSAEDMLGLVRRAREMQTSVIGVRKATATTHIEENWWRGLRHRGFLFACRALLGLETADSQCGGKVIRGDDYRAVSGKLKELGFAFDAELLAQLSSAGFRWEEVPVNWIEKRGSRLRVMDSWHMLRALLRIRGRIS